MLDTPRAAPYRSSVRQLSRGTVRVLGPADLPAATRLGALDPVANVFVLSRLRSVGLGAPRSGGEMWGHHRDGELTAMCYFGANVVPVAADAEAVAAFGEQAATLPRRCSSIVGRAEQVLPLWQRLAPAWGPAREIRSGQPLLELDGPVRHAPDPGVRVVRPAELDLLLPACVAMFTEEVGISPMAADGGALYRARVRELIETRRAYARIEDGEVVFKAEVGAASGGVCQVQGVWVNPAHRGRGLAAGGMAAVVELARREVAPIVSLYVNDYNLIARAVYRRVGFRQAATFCSVLF
ncbi:MAG TPA: GNAT family N-acetyltransferase [Sporichthyaceae bacterium]